MKERLNETVARLLHEANALIGEETNDSIIEAALKIMQAHTSIKETPGFKKIEPEYRKAIEVYREIAPDLIVRIEKNGLDFDDRYYHIW